MRQKAWPSSTSQNDKSVAFLYGTKAGRVILHLLLLLKIPALLGLFLRSPFSRCYIKPFIKKHCIDMKDFAGVHFSSFNDFFTRKKDIHFDSESSHFIAPADSLFSVYNIEENSTFFIKGFDYSLNDFFEAKKFSLDADKLAKTFAGGLCLVFRLCASDYHRYCYVDDCAQAQNHFIQGTLYSVQPAAAKAYRLYTKNRRSWTLLDTKNFGLIAQVEIGAFSVGGIQNHHENYVAKKGEEKGYFDLHGSTIVLLVQKGSIVLNKNVAALVDGAELRVKIGEWIATSTKNAPKK